MASRATRASKWSPAAAEIDTNLRPAALNKGADYSTSSRWAAGIGTPADNAIFASSDTLLTSLWSTSFVPNAGLSPAGPEILVNTTTQGDQREPAIAALGNNNYVTAWIDFRTIKLQISTADGTQIGTEISATSANAVSHTPDLASLSNGNFVLIWGENPLQGGSSFRAQIFSPNGTAAGGSILVDDVPAFPPRWHADIAGMAGGGFVVIWSDDSADRVLKGQTFNNNGDRVGAEVVVYNEPLGIFRPVIAALAGGGYVIAWSSPPGTVWARTFDSSGAALGERFQVSTSLGLTPAIAGLPGGGFVIGWTEVEQNGSSDTVGIRAQLYNSSAVPVGPAFAVHSNPVGVQEDPQVAALSSGGFIISWTDTSGSASGVGADTSGSAIRAQAFNATGAKTGAEVLINAATGGDQRLPALASLTDGRIIFAWQDGSAQGGDSSGTGIKARLFGAGSTPVDGIVDRNVTLEMVRLAAEAYDSTGDATLRGWRTISAAELGLATSGTGEGGLAFSYAGGIYYATGPTGPFSTEAAAIVLRARVDGKITLAVAFRGTDSASDWGDYVDFDSHYRKFSPLISAIDAYVGNAANGIQQVLVSGHSLGAAMAQHFMAGHTADIYRAFTIGSPGGDNAGGNDGDSRIVNFGHTDDPVFSLPADLTESVVRAAIAVAVPPLGPLLIRIQDKDHQGSNVHINSEVRSNAYGLGEHDKWLYLSDLQRMFDFATDGVSSFRLSPLAQAIAAGQPYSGSLVHVAIGDTRDSAPERIDIDWRDQWVLGSPGNDEFKWELNIRTDAQVHRIDGGLGMDTVLLPWFKSSWSWQAVASGRYDLSYQGRVVGELTGVEKLFFFLGKDVLLPGGGQQAGTVLAPFNTDPLAVVYLDGTPATVQRPGAGDATITANGTADYLDAGDGNIAITGTAGNDVILLGNGSQSVAALEGDDVISAEASNGAATGLLLVDGGGGNDLITGDVDVPGRLIAVFSGAHADYAATKQGDRIILTDLRGGAPDGVDTLQMVNVFRFADGDLTEAQLLAVNLSGGEVADALSGDAGNDVILGNGGDDVLSGGGVGNDSLDGGAGDDILIGGAGNDTLNGGAGTDTAVYTAATAGVVVTLRSNAAQHTISAGQDVLIDIENLIGSSFVDELAGSDDTNVLSGGAGNDILDGGGGADSMSGGTGDDLFVVDDAGDQAIEALGEGNNDRVLTRVSYALTAGSEIELLAVYDFAGTSALDLSGNAFGQIIFGNDGTNNLYGHAGNDTLYGLGSNDAMDGGAGGDTMFGGAGDDIYVIDNLDDQAIERMGEGTNDRVLTSVSFQLGVGSEIELFAAANLAGTGALDLTGNELGQIIIGNDGVNNLYSRAGNDTLYGLAGNDALDGGTGGDTMFGGSGDDIYVIDNLDDQAIERMGEGTNDRVLTSVSFQLGVGNEIELFAAANLAGTGALDLTGNELGQIIIGNDGVNNLYSRAGNDTLYGLAGNDALDGGTGADTMFGGAGDDTYAVDDLGDQAIEAAGQGMNDRVLASISFQMGVGSEIELIAAYDLGGTTALNLIGNDLAQTLIGNAGVNTLNGLAGNDTLYGLDGDDVLDGGTGSDYLIGGAGADQLLFTTALGAGNIDQVIGFATGSDRLVLNNAVFAGLGPGALAAGAFRAGSAAQDGDDRIIYDAASGTLYFDADGNGAGAAIQFATLTPGTALAASDFTVIGSGPTMLEVDAGLGAAATPGTGVSDPSAARGGREVDQLLMVNLLAPEPEAAAPSSSPVTPAGAISRAMMTAVETPAGAIAFLDAGRSGIDTQFLFDPMGPGLAIPPSEFRVI